MHDYEDLFGMEGPLATAIPGFATREEQIAMAEQVAIALRSPEHPFGRGSAPAPLQLSELAPKAARSTVAEGDRKREGHRSRKRRLRRMGELP